MEKDYDASLTRCSWDGDPAGWTDFVRRVRLLYEKTPRKKRRQLGPSIVAQLRDRAWTITQDVNHQKLTRRDGSVYLLEFLRDRLGRSPIPDVGIRLEELMIRLRRSPGTAMSSWASQVRQTYKRVQVALHRARKEHGLHVSQEPQVREAVPPRQPSAPSSPSNASRRDRGSPTRRSSETTQEPTAEEEGQPEEDAFDAEYDETEFELRDAGPKRSWQKGRKKKPDDDDDDSDDSAQMMKDLEVWDRYEEGLEEVLPGEVLGWLLLRRANLPTSARLSIQAAAGNSLLFTDIERAMRSMEDELMVHDEAKRNHQPRRRSFWVEEEGEWSLVMAPEEDLQELVSSSEVHYVGSRLPPEVYYHHEPEPASYHGETGFWHQDDDGAFSFWEMAEDGEFYTQDTTGLYWAWHDWEDFSGGTSTAPSDATRDAEDAFSLQDPKSRNFTQARQAVKARNLSRGFYPFNPGSKGKPRFKGKGKGKGKGKPSFPRSPPAPILAATSDIFAQPGDPSFSGCFVCGSKEHSWRSCPKRSSTGKGSSKGKGARNFMAEGIFMVSPDSPREILQPDKGISTIRDGDKHEILDTRTPSDMCLDFRWGELQDTSYVVTSHQIDDAFASGQGEAQPRGHAVIDSGATETVGSLPAIEDLMAVRYELNGVPDSFQISSTPPRRFRFGNGSIGFSLSQMLIPQDLGPVRVDLGVFSLDVENVPILIGIKTLRALRTVLDCHQDVAVFAALDPSTGVKLRRSPSGHLLIDLSRNWLQDSFSILSPAARIPEVPPTTFEAEENIGAVFVLEPLPSDFQARGDTHLEYEAAPESPSSCPAVLFHSRGCADSAPGEDSSGCLEDPFRILRALVRGHGHSDCREQRLVCGSGGSFSGQGQSCGEACSVEGQGEGERHQAQSRACPRVGLEQDRRSQSQGRALEGAPMYGIPCRGDKEQPTCHVATLHPVQPQAHLHPPGWQDRSPPCRRTPQPRCPGGGDRDQGGFGFQPSPEGSGHCSSSCREQHGAPAREDQDAEGQSDPQAGPNGSKPSATFLTFERQRRSCEPKVDRCGEPRRGECRGYEPDSWEQATSSDPSGRAGVSDENPGPAVMHVVKQGVREIEDLARQMCHDQLFSFKDCEQLLFQFMAVREAISQSNRSTLEPKNGTGYNVFGLFSHGNMSGITRKSHELPWLCKYVNLFGKHHLAQEGSCWTSFAVNFNQPMNIHLDPNNDPGSSNFTCSFGDFKGGQLWVELTEDSDPSVSPVRWKTKRNGQRVPGHLHTTQHRFIQFSPKSFHATDRWSGTRISLTFYSSRLIAQSTEARRECLKKLGFPLPRSVRPLKYDDNEGEDAYAVDPVEGQGAGEVLLCQDVRHLLQASCEEVWDEVNSLLDVHGRDPHCLQVVEFGGPADSPLCSLLGQQGGQGLSANLSQGFDLGTRGGCHRAHQQLEQRSPAFAWFQLPKGPCRQGSDSDRRQRAMVNRSRKVLRNVISLSQQQLRGGECVWVSEKHSSAWRDRDSCQFWQTLAESGKAFEWQHGDLQIRTTSKAMFLDCSRVSSKMESVENQWDYLYRAFCGSVMNFHGASSASGEGNPVYAVTAQKEALEGVDKKELESLLDTVQKLHRRFGHPSNSLLLKNLRARGASPKLLAVAAEFKCDMCMENQIRTSAPAVSLKREDRLWCTLQIDGFYMRIGQEVFHYLLMVDEASGFCVVEEMIRHPEKEMRHMTTAQVCRTLELRWCQIFGFPETIKLDPEGAFRGLDLGEYCSSRGIELSVIPAEYHEGISEVERSIGTIRRKIEAFMRQEQYHPTRAAAQMVAAHNTMARTLGFSPAQWAFGRDVTVTGHSRERPGEVCAQSAMSDPSHGMAESLELRTRAEKAFIEARAREVMSRAMNSRTRPAKRFLPGDIIFYQRFQVPQDAPANSVVDRPRMGIARFYGPARVLATETRVVSEEGVRKPSAIVWAVCNGRLKRFHQSQVRHSTESERLIAEGAAGAEFPWTFASLASLLDRGSFDDETIVRSRTRGRSKTPARSRSVPPGRRAAPEPPVLPPQLHYGPEPEAEDFEEEEEMIPVPAEMSRGSKRPDPEPPHDDEAEMIPVPQAHNSLVENLDMSRFLNDPQYLPANFVTLDQEESESSAYVIQNASCASLQDESPAFAVTLAAPSSEAEWKALVKNPKRFIAKSVQKGVEVSYAKLNGVQRAAMDEAMKVEVDNWMKTQAVRAVQKFLPQRELLKMRWVLTFKSAPDESAEPKDGQPASDSPKASGERIKAKARIVILGYSDPNLLEANTVSPAMSRLSRQLLLNMASVRKWDILCGDVKSAFLQAKSPQGQRCVFAAPVPELARALGLQEGQAVQLLRSCYGLVSAPREWYEDVHRTLVSLGAERLTTDSCVWRIRDASGAVVGLVSSHVDDFLMTGCSSSKAWQDFLHGFKNAYEWSPWEHGAFRHCGVNIMQHPDHSVSLDHSSFCQELKQLDPIREERKLTLAEVSQVRAVLGSVQWRVYQSAPQHAAKLNYLQSLIASQDSSIVEQVNKLIREVYSARSLSVQVQSLGAEDPEQLCMIAWSDASLANRPDFSSTGGHLIALMHQQSLEAGMGRINPIAWKSGRLHRIARSSLSAESQALADTEQELFFARLEWREMIGDYVDAKVPENTAAKVPSYLVVDAKAMFDTLSKGVFVASQKDKYTGLELLSLSQHLEKQKTVLLWCDSNHMLADGLTKASKQDVLKRFLASGYWRIRYDGAFISAKKRRQMLREPAAENVTNSVFLQCTEQAQALKCFGILPGGMSEDLYKSVLPPPSSACKHSVLTSRSSFGPRS